MLKTTRSRGTTARATSIPAGPCYDAVSTQTAQSGSADESVAVSVRLPLNQCRDDFGGATGSCVDKLQQWLDDSSDSANSREIYIGYTMAFGDATGSLGMSQGFVQRQQLNCATDSGICGALLRTEAASALQQCEDTTAVGGEVPITQVTNLLTKTLAVAVQPVFSEIDKTPPCKTLATGQVVCPALLHDQCEGGKGVASVQHLIAACGGVYSGANMRTSSALATIAAAAEPTCSGDGGSRATFVQNCRTFDWNWSDDRSAAEALCNSHYQPLHWDPNHPDGTIADDNQAKMCLMDETSTNPGANFLGYICRPTTQCTVSGGRRRMQDAGCVDDTDGSQNIFPTDDCNTRVIRQALACNLTKPTGRRRGLRVLQLRWGVASPVQIEPVQSPVGPPRLSTWTC